MIDLQNQLSEESNKRDIGKVFEVLIEGFSKRSREQLFGRTSQNKVVIFDKKNYHVGQFIKVRINRASSATLFSVGAGFCSAYCHLIMVTLIPNGRSNPAPTDSRYLQILHHTIMFLV